MPIPAPPALETSVNVPVSGLAQCQPEEVGCPQNIQLSAVQVFAIAEQLAQKDKVDEAIRVLKVVNQDKNPDYRAEARVRIARLLVRKGDLYSAAQWYRRLLDEKPGAASVRIELAQVLAKLGDERAAAAQLRRAQSARGLPEPVAQALQRSVSYLRSQAPVSLDVSLGLAPDTNINAATSADTVTIWGLPFTLDKAGQATSGIGATYSAQITSRIAMAHGARWVTQAGSSGNIYLHHQFDDLSFFASTGPDISQALGSIRPALTVGQRLYGAHVLYNFYGGSITALIHQGRKGQFTLNGSILQFNYAHARSYQSGITRSVSLSYDRALSPVLTAHAGVSTSRANAQYPNYALSSASTELALSRDFKPFTLYGRIGYTHAWGDAEYPPFAVPRNDSTYEGNAGVIFRRISFRGLSPQIKGSYVRTDSPITLFSYSRLRGEISLVGSF